MLRSSLLSAAFWLLLVGCGDSAKISAEARLGAPLDVAMLSVTVRDRDRGWTWQGNDFHSTQTQPTPTTDERDTHTNGSAEVSFRLEESGAVLSEGSVSLPLRADWRWGVSVIAQTIDPREGCFGCVGSMAFPLAPSHRAPDRDSIWVVWGGNSISDPVVY
jgi:hypothetical protein